MAFRIARTPHLFSTLGLVPPYGLAEAPPRRCWSDGRKAAGLIGLVVLLLSAVGVALYILSGTDPCRPGRLPLSHLAVLVDPTDALSQDEAAKVRSTVWHYEETLAPGSWISLLALLPQQPGPVMHVKFSGCRPRDGVDAHAGWENPVRLRERYRTEFKTPLEQALAGLETWPEATTSPLFGALEEVATWRPFAPAPGVPRTLWLVSDLLVHTPGYSHYRPQPAPLQESVVTGLRGVLAGVEILVFLRRSAHTCPYQTPAHTQSWQTVMQLAGATNYRIKPLHDCPAPLPVVRQPAVGRKPRR